MIEYDIWTHPPDLTTSIKQSRVGHPDVVALTGAPEFTSFPEARSERIYAMKFSWDTPREFTAAKRFWAEKGGRHETFLLPTWQRDIRFAILPTAGTLYIDIFSTVTAPNYLTTTADDEVGRYIYAWDNINGLQVVRVLTAEAAGSGKIRLRIEQPWAATYGTEVMHGFALLVRFDDDEAEWKHADPSHCSAELTFRTTRESTLTDATAGLFDGVNIYQSLAFTGAAQTVAPTPLRFDVCEVLGPANRGLAQNGTYNVLWAAWPSTAGVRLLRGTTPGAIPAPTEASGYPCPYFTAPVTTSHISLAFDQNGYEVIAYENTDGTTTLKSSTVTVTWTGKSPCLFYNGQVNVAARIAGTTDVACYYLREGSGAILARFQRDNYATEYLIGGFPTQPRRLIKHAVAGRIHTFTATDAGFRLMSLTVTYPAQPAPLPDPYVMLAFADAVGSDVAWGDLQDEYAIVATAVADAAGTSASIDDIANDYVAPPPTNFSEQQDTSASIADITCDLVVVITPLPQEEAGALASIPDIAYDLIIPFAPNLPETATNDASLTDIYYGP